MCVAKFLAGVNQVWFSGAYAADMGRNQFSGSELRNWPYTDPVSFDFTHPDSNPPAALLSQQPSLVDQYFQLVQGVDITRIWVFERLEGLLFDQNNNVTGVDGELLTNMHKVLDSAQAHGVKVYLCLLDAWAVKNQPPSGLSPARLPKYNEWNATVRQIMKSIVESPSGFVANALIPLVNSVATHPALCAIDLMNEPEGMMSDTPVVSNAAMRGYISTCCQAIKPAAKASIGCMRSSTARGFSDLPLDFSDFHSYGQTASLSYYASAGYSGKPCMVGECGYTVSSSNAAVRATKEVPVAEDYVQMALAKGYSSCLVWNRDFTSDANNAAIVQWLAQFAASNNQIVPEQPQSPFAALVAWLAALFGH
jgi:hypothetical protein